MRQVAGSFLGSIGRLIIAIACGLIAALALILWWQGGDDAPRVAPVAPPAVTAPAAQPASALSELAVRLLYIAGTPEEPWGDRAWGSACKLARIGHASVDHVTINAKTLGPPRVGPVDPVTARDELSDWSFLGVDPATLDYRDYLQLAPGMVVEIHGFPARDTDGEIVPGIVYMDDPDPETLFWWVELVDSPGPGIPGEGVVGGFSGSCLIGENGVAVAVVSANGFSHIPGTTHTWAKVVPIRAAIRAAQGLPPEESPPAIGLMRREVPEIEMGRWRMIQ